VDRRAITSIDMKIIKSSKNIFLFKLMGCCASKEPGDRGQGGYDASKNDRVNSTLDDVYRKYDKDGSGGLDHEETRNFLNDMMKRNNQTVSEGELNNFIQQVDKNRDGSLQKDEIFDLYKRISQARGQGN